jgi:serine/threonine protein kinase
MDTDRNLLFGVLALQADVISRDQFVEACTLWASRKDVALADLLAERGWVSPEDRADVERLVERKLKKHSGDVKAGLAEAAGEDVRRSLAAVEDADVRQSLADAAPSGGRSLSVPPLWAQALPVAHDAASPPGSVSVSTEVASVVPRERYTLTRLHAQGGIGRVWLARDADLGREVALKEVRPERSQSPSLWTRFLLEAKITGQLEHPAIVPVYELGKRSDDQQPFYTMRFIRGRTLSEVVEAHHQRRKKGETNSLELRALLGAFLAVCNAVSYAHSRAVIHRDLKGQNVVLGDFGEVMLLDWGLAKVLPPRTGPGGPAGATRAEESLLPQVALDAEAGPEATMQGQVVGTPAYMAPEQAEGRLDLIDVRTDVYGLGALLYEILGGQPPFNGPDTQEVIRQVIHAAPAPPRELAAGVPRALQAVCLKALAKRPAHRYPSARALAHEVEHWLADEPVAAYAEPLPTRLARWGRRHKPLVAGAAALLMTAVAALGLGTVLLRQKQQEILAERNAATSAQARAEAVSNFLINDLLGQAAPDQNARDKKMTVEQLLDRAARKIADNPRFADQPATEASLRWIIGTTYRNLGAFAEAETHLRRAMDLRRAALGPDDPDTLKAQEDLATLLAIDLRRPDLTLCWETWQARARVLGAQHPDTLDSMDGYATALGVVGRQEEAEPVMRECFQTIRRVLGMEHELSLRSANNLGVVLIDRGQFEAAEPILREALEVRRRLSGLTGEQAAGLLNNLCVTRLMLDKDLPETEALLREGRAVMQGSHGKEHPYTIHLGHVLVRVLLEQGKLDKAEALGREVLELRRTWLPKGHESVGRSLLVLGRILVEKGRAADAEPMLREALALFRERYAGKRELTAETQDWLGAALAAQQRYPDAELLLVKGYEGLQAFPGVSRKQREAVLGHLVALYQALGKPDKAAEWRARRDAPPRP